MAKGLLNLRNLSPEQIREFLPAIDGVTSKTANLYADLVESRGHLDSKKEFIEFLKKKGNVQSKNLKKIENFIEFEAAEIERIETPVVDSSQPVSFQTSLYAYQSGLSLGAPVLLNPILPNVFFSGIGAEIQGLADKIKQYANDPSQLITGPKSTGTREDAISRWEESCQQEGQTADKDFPKRKSSIEWFLWDEVRDELYTHVTLTWFFDRCNIYDADVKFSIQRNDEPTNNGAIKLASFSIPEVDPVKRKICQPCTPRCLKVSITVIYYAIPVGGAPGTYRNFNIDVTICAGDTRNFTDNTDYDNNQGDGNGARGRGSTPLEPPLPGKGDKDGTWGVVRLEGPNDYFPKKP